MRAAGGRGKEAIESIIVEDNKLQHNKSHPTWRAIFFASFLYDRKKTWMTNEMVS